MGASTPEPKFYLDKLPAEISTEIYQHLFAESKILVEEKEFDVREYQNVNPQVLLTCYKIRNEALPYLTRVLKLGLGYNTARTIHTHLATDFLSELQSLTFVTYNELFRVRFQGQNLLNLLPALQTLEIQHVAIGCNHVEFLAATLFNDADLEGKSRSSAVLFEKTDQLLSRDCTLSTRYHEHMFDEALIQLFEDPNRTFRLLLVMCFFHHNDYASGLTPMDTLVSRALAVNVDWSLC